MQIIDELRTAIESKKYSIKDIEEAIGMPRNNLSSYLKKGDIPDKYLVNLVQFLNIDDKPQIVKEGVSGVKKCLDEIKKDFGEGSVMQLGDAPIKKVETIPSGSISLDIAVGIGGLPRGRVIEIYGPESSGKTTIASHVIANAQKLGLSCAIIDTEHSFDPNRAKDIGVDIDKLILSQPDYGEQALEIADRLCDSGYIGIVVIDSVAALVPKAELEGEMGDSKMGLQARLMSQAMRKLVGTVAKKNVLLIFTNQLREKIGVMFGNPETQPGGNALKFFSSIRLDIRRIATLKDGDIPYGSRVRVKVVKNKLAPPFKVAEFDLLYSIGINQVGEVIDIGVGKNVIQKSGSWYSYKNHKIGQGRDAAMQLLFDNPELFMEIKNKILQ